MGSHKLHQHIFWTRYINFCWPNFAKRPSCL